jgi:sugar phosphate isomerase/epimerase
MCYNCNPVVQEDIAAMHYGAMNFPVNPLLEEIETIAALGFDYMELTMDPPRSHHSEIRRQRNQLLDALRRHRMGLVCHMPTFVTLADLTDAIREASLNEVLRSLETAADLGAEKVVVHPAYISGLGVYVMEQARGRAFDSLAAIVYRAREMGLRVCLENMFPRTRFCADIDDFKEVFERFPDLELTLDTGHANIGSSGGRRIRQFVETFGDRIGHLHVSDNFGKEDNHLPIGSGSIRFPAVIEALQEAHYDGTVTFEVFTPDRSYLRLSREKFAEIWRQTPDVGGHRAP